LNEFDLILLPGFIQWNTAELEQQYSIKVRKGPEFASDIPMVLKNLDTIELSTEISANKLFHASGEKAYQEIVREIQDKAKKNLGKHTFHINPQKSELLIGKDIPPPIIAEIVNCTQKDDDTILKKAKHYIESGAQIIDIGCVSNKPNPERITEIVKLLNQNFNLFISIDSMDPLEIRAAVEAGADLILSLDFGNYKNLLDLPKDIPAVILPTNIKKGFFPKNPKARVERLLELTKILNEEGFLKLIADPLLETPISPGLCKSLEAYFLYRKEVSKKEHQHLERPLFFGISNVVELMDIDSVGINGLLASIAVELDMGVLFTVEHSTKLMSGVAELKECVKLNYLAKQRKTPPINQGIQIFKAKGKTSGEMPEISRNDAILVPESNKSYQQDEKGYFKIYIDHYAHQISVLFFTRDHLLQKTLIGAHAEEISKKIIDLNLTDNLYHLNYLGRELAKAELYLNFGKPYIQDEEINRA